MTAVRRRAAVPVILFLCACLLAPAAQAKPSTLSVLQGVVSKALAGSGAPRRGAVFEIDGIGRIAVNPDLPLPPASTQKLYVAGTALLRLGPDAVVRTELLSSSTATIEGGTVPGDLVFRAGGDPTLKAPALDLLAFEVAGRGITHVIGSLVVDDSRYDRARTAPGWQTSFVPSSVGALSAFALDGNKWRRDRAFLRDPVPANATRLRAALGRAGITVDGPTTISATIPPAPDMTPTVLATRASPAVRGLLRIALKESDNFVTELLLKELGATEGAPSTRGGLAVVARTTGELGVAFGQSADGSGLSSFNRQTAAGEVAWLRALFPTTAGGVLRDGLPLACRDGTLKTRLCRTAASGRVRAKTGTLSRVVTLAGYATTARGRRVTFAVLLHGSGSAKRARDAVDRAVREVIARA